MPRFFPRVTQAFSVVDLTSGELPLKEFLDAVDAFIEIFQLLGTAFKIVKSDMSGNVSYLRKILETDGGAKRTAEKYIADEIAAGKKVWDKSGTATLSLLWLKRGLEYKVVLMSKLLAKPNEELKALVNEAYAETLTNYHNFIVRGVFRGAALATPYRKDLEAQLSDDREQLMGDLQQFLQLAQPLVAHCTGIFVKHGINMHT